ncbi:Hypothetical predicted protein [Olea europaea subsp. europaea]|uniref:Uncharacterized protein n=1 Tax=Olea europaea subsp. europaea TaxID=158383 RepID=A0A8S0PXZ1_OLEEU|nr:Hypothetical predicted protein [Olea europaea subsp. europaea]
MLEKPSMDSAATTANVATVKRYAPPSQRNRSLGRRKSGGDRLERANSYSNDGEKNAVGTFRNIPMAGHGDASGNNRTNENPRSKLIPLHGCCNSEALRLLNDRWTAAMTALNNLPEDSAERPILYSRKSAPAWGQAVVLPHLLMQPAGGPSTGLQSDFLTELRQAMHKASTGANA